MVLGIGLDLVYIPRIERAVKRWGERFLQRIFSDVEREYVFKKRDPFQSLALRFAAKEACAKALGTGIGTNGIRWNQIVVINRERGRPELHLKGAALRQAKEIGASSWLVTMSHERTYAAAVVILTA